MLPEDKEPNLTQKVGIMVADPAKRKLLEAIAAGLELDPVLLGLDDFSPETLGDFELIVVNESCAKGSRPKLEELQRASQQIKPVLIAVVPAPAKSPSQSEEGRPTTP